jgi:hypothetical protein
MSRRLAALRLALAAVAITALAACASPTAPTSRSLRAPVANHNLADSSGGCRSGYTVGQGYTC